MCGHLQPPANGCANWRVIRSVPTAPPWPFVFADWSSDLIANGERRLRQGQHEDALVRAYRVLELIGQARLFDLGLDSGDLDRGHHAVQALQRKIEKKGQDPLTESHGGALQASRFQVARLLKQCGDTLAGRLLEFDREALLKPSLRNNSLLIHGFVARAPDDPESLRRLFGELARLAQSDSDRNTIDEWLFCGADA